MKNVAIVTGASRGIGAATALLLAQRGYAVCINYNNAKEKADNLVKKIHDEGGQAIAVKADVAKEQAISALFATVDKELGPITALVNNAGINGTTCEVENMTSDTLQAVFSTNVFGTFICCREAIKRMKENQGGAIVNITSEAARFGGTRLAHYAASKAAINTFTIACAREVASHNIRINAISPGVIDTDIHATSSAERLNNLITSLPMKRMGKASEVAELTCWLLSAAASYVSGAVIPITGAR
ncbi:MAG: Glucose 1-dehydrogenase [Gammaproteobacteria bacterium]|jgi:NAD(P)-dependent dehydrogenase (short-subunit alcohol dehydrogenase family)|nr:Glucose 1-dehydrogenase [Gammaproteobacteria bacterium]